MKIYKVVPCAESLVVKKNEAAQTAIVKFFDVIGQECVDGWEFHSMAPVSITRKLGKFKKRDEHYNAFIFVKEAEVAKE
ncbi:MAG: hypothetical protein IJW13_02340 [Clostridia bacterium]|nr:hypothetical protein [Clostridia bacterium]